MLREPQLQRERESPWLREYCRHLATLHQALHGRLALGALQRAFHGFSAPQSPREGPQSHKTAPLRQLWDFYREGEM